MASPAAIELRARTDEELQGELETAHQALFNLRFQAATRQLADVKQVSRARRQVARIKTLMRERSILAEVDAGTANLAGAADTAKLSDAADAAELSDAADAAKLSDAADAAGEEE